MDYFSWTRHHRILVSIMKLQSYVRKLSNMFTRKSYGLLIWTFILFELLCELEYKSMNAYFGSIILITEDLSYWAQILVEDTVLIECAM